MVLRCIVHVVVDAEDDGEIFVLGRGRDDDLLDGALRVLGSVVAIGEAAGGFDNDFCAGAGPVDLRGVFDFEYTDPLAAYRDALVIVGDFVAYAAEDRVVLEQVGEGLVAREVVGCDDFDVGVAKRRAKYIASNTAKAVDR